MDLESFRDTTSPYFLMLPNKEQATQHLQNRGVGLSKPVVCYDSQNGMWAARGMFILRALGFKDVKVLDGSLKAWADRKTESGDAKGNDTDFNIVMN